MPKYGVMQGLGDARQMGRVHANDGGSGSTVVKGPTGYTARMNKGLSPATVASKMKGLSKKKKRKKKTGKKTKKK